jgi:translation initiation factor 1
MSIVYSTGRGRMCAGCRRPIAECVCTDGQGKPARARANVVRVSRQTQGRAGKAVTLISGLALAPGELQSLASELKRRCGSGGTIKDGVIEIQGEHRDSVLAELTRRGIAAKRAGG